VRRTASEKIEIIRLVEDADLPVRETLRRLGVPRSTFDGFHRAQRLLSIRASSWTGAPLNPFAEHASYLKMRIQAEIELHSYFVPRDSAQLRAR
jgi:hypothetical protein